MRRCRRRCLGSSRKHRCDAGNASAWESKAWPGAVRATLLYGLEDLRSGAARDCPCLETGHRPACRCMPYRALNKFTFDFMKTLYPFVCKYLFPVESRASIALSARALRACGASAYGLCIVLCPGWLAQAAEQHSAPHRANNGAATHLFRPLFARATPKLGDMQTLKGALHRH